MLGQERRVFLMSVRMRPPEDWERDASARRGTQSGKPGSQHDVRRVTACNESCPIPRCSSDVVVVLFGRAGRLCQAAMTGSLTKGSSLIGAMVSRET